MQLDAEQIVHLLDTDERQVGQIVIEQSEDNLVFGKFVPGPAFPGVQRLFREFEEAVNLQALSVIDELDVAIGALGLHLRSPDGLQRIEIYDVQIWSDGRVTYRLGSPSRSAVATGLESTQPMADEHPTIASRDWRLRAITTLVQPYRSPSGQVYLEGTPVELAGFVLLPGGQGLSIPVPDPTAIYLSLAKKELQKAIEYEEKVLPSVAMPGPSGQKRLDPRVEQGFFDCLESLMAAVVFSYTAIEVFANSIIPDGYLFSTERKDKKCIETYSKDQIERFISLDTKLDEVLPPICSVPSPKGTKLWQQYVNLKELRNRFIHLKSTDWKSSAPENANDYVWTWLLSEETRKVAVVAFDLIMHFLPAKKPRWALRFGEIAKSRSPNQTPDPADRNLRS